MRLGDGERLRLTRLARKARALPAPPPGFRGFRLLVVSNRTTHFLAEALEAAGVARGLLIEAVEAPFDSIQAIALNPAFEAPAGPFDAVLLLADAHFLRGAGALLDAAQEAADIDRAEQELARIVAGLRARFGAPVIAATAPLPPELQLSSSDMAISGAAKPPGGGPQSRPGDGGRAARAGAVRPVGDRRSGRREAFFDPVRLHQAKTPFSLEVTPSSPTSSRRWRRR